MRSLWKLLDALKLTGFFSVVAALFCDEMLGSTEVSVCLTYSSVSFFPPVIQKEDCCQVEVPRHGSCRSVRATQRFLMVLFCKGWQILCVFCWTRGAVFNCHDVGAVGAAKGTQEDEVGIPAQRQLA